MGSSSDETKRTVISFEDDQTDSGEQPTEVLEKEPDLPRKKRRIIVEDNFDSEDDESAGEFEEGETEDDDPSDAPEKRAQPSEPGFFERLGVPGRQIAALAAGVVAGLLLVSLATVYVVTEWTPLLPDPKVGKVGPVGDAGVRGPQGLIGRRGPRGTKGKTGPQGPQGENGPDGIVTIQDLTDG